MLINLQCPYCGHTNRINSSRPDNGKKEEACEMIVDKKGVISFEWFCPECERYISVKANGGRK